MDTLQKQNRVAARRKWRSELSGVPLDGLDLLSLKHGFSVSLGDVIFLNGTCDQWRSPPSSATRSLLRHLRRTGS